MAASTRLDAGQWESPQLVCMSSNPRAAHYGEAVWFMHAVVSVRGYGGIHSAGGQCCQSLQARACSDVWSGADVNLVGPLGNWLSVTWSAL
jgi:hypothetical protein